MDHHHLTNVPGPEEPEQAPPSPIYIPIVPDLFTPTTSSYQWTMRQQSPADREMMMNEEDDDAEEEEHLAPADPTVVAYSADQDPYLAYRVTARMSIRHQASAPFLFEEAADYDCIALPTPTTITSLSITHHHFLKYPSLPLPYHHQPPKWPYISFRKNSLGSRAAGIRQRYALRTYHRPVHETRCRDLFTRF
ncbi:hypothetical protein Tco_0527754 [Tanacetum coccineum]